MLQGNHALCELGEKKFIFLIKIKRESKGGKNVHRGFGFVPQDPEGFCAP